MMRNDEAMGTPHGQPPREDSPVERTRERRRSDQDLCARDAREVNGEGMMGIMMSPVGGYNS